LSYDTEAISLSEVISAMTFALDMTEGAVPGHALRTCLLGMRLADALGVCGKDRVSLYYALLLKDIGCSSNATRVTQIMGGNDLQIKASTKRDDWRKRGMSFRGLQVMWRNTLPEEGLGCRMLRFFQVARNSSVNRKELIALRCERGAQILLQLGMDASTLAAVRSLDEHWDGEGHPVGLKGTEIPLLARICSVAQSLDIFASEESIENAMKMLHERSGVWFDPRLVKICEMMNREGSLWEGWSATMDETDLRAAVMLLDPGEHADLTPERVDLICEAFASVVDAKSPFTYRHSVGVADVAVSIAQQMGLPSHRIQLVRRAALLHDIGKLAVPNSILDKQGKLTQQEWDIVLAHPGYTRSILERVSAFRELAVIASEHHEKLDGTGYPLGLTASELSLESRILIVADTFAAMAEHRPYRKGMETGTVFQLMSSDVPKKFDFRCFASLRFVWSDRKWRHITAHAI
jgi:putative nucleotidyltransferase with HDIG domain